MDWFNGRPSMVHPDHMVRAEDAAGLPLVEPVYPLTAGLSGKVLAPHDSAGAWSGCPSCRNGRMPS